MWTSRVPLGGSREEGSLNLPGCVSNDTFGYPSHAGDGHAVSEGFVPWAIWTVFRGLPMPRNPGVSYWEALEPFALLWGQSADLHCLVVVVQGHGVYIALGLCVHQVALDSDSSGSVVVGPADHSSLDRIGDSNVLLTNGLFQRA